MQVVKVIPETFEFVKTDDEEWPTYRRYQDGRWENLMGESWEPVYYTEQLEAAYQAFKTDGKSCNCWDSVDGKFHLVCEKHAGQENGT